MSNSILKPTKDDTDRFKNLEDMMQAQHSYLQWLGNRFMNKQDDPINPYIFLDEFTRGVNSGTSLVLQLNIDTPVLIQSWIVGFSGTSANLQMGDRQIPVTPSNVFATGIAEILYKNDKVILTSGTSGPMYIEIMGKVLRGSEWNQT